CRFNKIRAMKRKFGTPELFFTGCVPGCLWMRPILLGPIGCISPNEWTAMTEFQRHRFIAHNPGPAAIFLDEVIRNLIRLILKYNPQATLESENGLFG
ncbi:hypothetical protein B0H11DRAFT_1646354, partial [Mycena galericulata]